LRGKLAHYKDQLMQVKTNTQYQAMLHEIAYVEEKIAGREDAILEEMLEADDLEERLRGAREQFAQTERGLKEEIRAKREFAEASDAVIAALDQERERVEASVADDFVTRYRRIAAARQGLALVPIQGQSCSACHVRLRPQLVAEIKAGRQVILCENCNRILYFEAS
jgi:predicted  nucleic acid-binding Zn-ribbon protein